MKRYTKNKLITALKDIRDRGYIPCSRLQNYGRVGNTLEDLLGLPEDNLPLPDAAEWELKTQRSHTRSLVTLFRMEPSPVAMRLVTSHLLPLYGWPHGKAGQAGFAEFEKSFRQSVNATTRSERGFKVEVDDTNQRIAISFDPSAIAPKHQPWLDEVINNVGLPELNPQPYWEFNDVLTKAAIKLTNCFFVIAKVRRKGQQTLFHYHHITMLCGFNPERFLDGIRQGAIYINFDARTGHNHGTQFRIRQSFLPELYDEALVI